MNAKLFYAAIAGTVVSFLLGWILYGLLLKGFFDSQTIHYEGLMMAMPNIFLLILANLSMSFFLALIFQRWAGITTFIRGFYAGMTVGFFFALTVDLFFLSMLNLYTPAYAIVDVILSTLLNGVVGGVIGMVLGSGKKAVAT
jgi:hypothetical protein